MKCVVPGANVKVLARAIHSLFRIGDELFFEPQPKALAIRAVNSARSAYASFTFEQCFFSFYEYEQAYSQDEDVTCKVAMKSCLAVFRSPNVMEKQVESCQIRLEPDGVKLIFELRCRYGIVKTHYLPIIECETLDAVYSKDMVPNRLIANAKILSDMVQNFQSNTPEVTLVVTPHKMLLRNYYDEEEEELKKSVRTELCLEPGEFDQYTIGTDTSITFCLKEFKSMLQFAEAFGLPVIANFEVTARPIVFVIKNVPTFEANFVLATLNPATLRRKGSSANSSQQSISQQDVIQNKGANAETINQDPNAVKRHHSSKIGVKRKSFISNGFTDAVSTERLNEPSCSGINKQKDASTRISEDNSRDIARISVSTGALDEANNKNESDEEDAVPLTPPPPPPSKKGRFIFQRCFENTFNSMMLPGHEVVLADNSDEDDTMLS